MLSRLYWQGQIAYVGGGHSTGVHNVMEPAVARLPVIFGPRYHNSHEAEELINNNGGFCVKDGQEFLSIIKNLISDSKYHKMTSLSASDVSTRTWAQPERWFNKFSVTRMIAKIRFKNSIKIGRSLSSIPVYILSTVKVVSERVAC